MSNDNWEYPHFEALYTVAEDIYRFSPWEIGIEPFVLMDPEHPEAYVVVVFEESGDGVFYVRLLLGAEGLRAWMVEDSLDENDENFVIEEAVGRYEGLYLEVGFNTDDLNNFEKRLTSGRERIITFRRQRPGYGMASIVDSRDYAHLHRYLRAILQLLTRQMLGDHVNATFSSRLDGHQPRFTAAAFALGESVPEPAEDFVFDRKRMMKAQPMAVDEFTNARVMHLEVGDQIMELFYFYLPSMADKKGRLPRAFFLVDLETGFIEWNDVQMADDDWRENLLRALWDYFFEIGERPERLIFSNLSAYVGMRMDCIRAGIFTEWVPHSYIGKEILESYLSATHLKAHQLFEDHFPKEPY
ncbi:MAG: hypothetical protein Q4C56_02985 [Peptococcaceae bacterium]|nr:hypothetical protein [Peptococcaceae bacterium]